MKQGTANSRRGDTKVEPTPHAVSPCSAGSIGLQYVGKSEPLYDGRGYEAPTAAPSTHRSGSQGKH